MKQKNLMIMLTMLMSMAVGCMTLMSCGDDEPAPQEQQGQEQQGKKDTHGYVDLGLPSGTLWATMNIGASSPEDYGDYFAWGETTGYNSGKTNFDWSTYKYCNGINETLTKYCNVSSYGYHGFTDTLTELEPADDAAYVNWGSDWRMPSVEQFRELINWNNTTTTWTTQNGVEGRLITSKSNGHSIFLPAAGHCYWSSLDFAGSYGYYWSRTLSASYPQGARYLGFDSSSIGTYGNGRCDGQSVRPVRAVNGSGVSAITLSSSSLTLNSGATAQLTATVLPSDASQKTVTWSSSNTAVATVSNVGLVTAVGSGSATITCMATDGSGVSASCTVTVVRTDRSGSIDGHDYVDLGLPSGTLWATCNVGATSPEGYGNYYAWGETRTKSDYSPDTYTYSDNPTELPTSADVAYVNWSRRWRMPTIKQFQELINSNYTTTTWTTQNGVYGRKITSKTNGNSIFLPAAGYRFVSSLMNGGSYGEYWSRTLITSGTDSAYGLYFVSSNISAYYSSSRFCGSSVRPVRASQ